MFSIGFEEELEVQDLVLSNPGGGTFTLLLNGQSITLPGVVDGSEVLEAVESLFDTTCSVSMDPKSLVFREWHLRLAA